MSRRIRSAVSRPAAIAVAILSLALARSDEVLAAHDQIGGETNGVIQLPPIMVTGQLREAAVPEVPLDAVGSRNVFSPAQVRETGAREINDLIQYIPAISTRPYNGGEASAPSFSMRGLPDDGLTEYINVLIDGVPASPLPYGWTAFSFLPITLDRIYAIDYLRGADSVRYSPNTVGGVLNFITAPIPDAPSASVRATFGNDGYQSYSGTGGGSWGATGVGATAVYRQGDGYREDGGFRQYELNAKARQQLDDCNWLAVSVSYMDDYHQAPGGLTQAQFDADRFDNARPRNRFDGYRAVADAVYHHDLEERGSIEGFAYYSDTQRELYAQDPNVGSPTSMLDWTDNSYFVGAGVRIEKPVTLGSTEHTLYGGVRYQREWQPAWKMTSTPYAGGSSSLIMNSEAESDSVSVHVDDTFKLLEKLTIQAGVRLESIPHTQGSDPILGYRFSDDYFTALPGFGLSYELTPTWAVFGNYFHGFRAPQVWGYGDATLGNHGLTFEGSRAAELGTRLRGPAGVDAAVTLWRNDYDDFGVYYDGSYNNLGEILATGIDFEVDWNIGRVWSPLDGLTVGGALTLQSSELGSGPFEGNDVPYAWKEKASWRARYTRCGWSATLGGTYVGNSYSDEANTSTSSLDGALGLNPSRVLWDARLARLVPVCKNADIELAAGANNLFDHEWYVHSRGGFFGPGLAAGSPRQLYGSINLTVRF